jgi:SH3-like domain-containing protein
MSGEQRPGDWRFVCDLSGFEGWASDIVLTWDNKRVLRRFVGEEAVRHPQDLVQGRPDNQSVPWSRPEGSDVFLGVNDVTAESL